MQFDRILAKQLTQVCLFAYDFDPARLPGLENPIVTQFSDRPELGDATSFATLLEFPEHLVLAFQGTITEFKNPVRQRRGQSVLDWLQNFRVLLVPASGFRGVLPAGMTGRLHLGFANQLVSIYGDILTALKVIPDKPLIVTGHSQGGAIAAIATKALQLDGIEVSTSYTFAAPRPGDLEFGESVEGVCRVEFGDDIVPHVPPSDEHFGGILAKTIKKKFTGILSEFVDKLTNESNRYGAVGTLTYRRPGDDLMTDLSAKDEHDLSGMRRMHMLLAGSNLVEHHHLTRQEDELEEGHEILCYERMFD